MASINDGLRPLVATGVYDAKDAANAAQDEMSGGRLRTRVSSRVVKVDGVAVVVWVLIVRRAKLRPDQERAHKKAAQSCRSARVKLAAREVVGPVWIDRDAIDLLYRAERSALLLDGGL